MVTLFSVLALVGALVGMVILVRPYSSLVNALAGATPTSPTQRAERIHQLEHELEIVTKHNEWENCKRCRPLKTHNPKLMPPPKAVVSDIAKRVEVLEKKIKMNEIDYEYYEVTDGYGRVVDRFIKTPELPAAEYLNYLDIRPAEYDRIERTPPKTSAKPERFSR